VADQFDSPASGAKITDFDGSLLLLSPTEHREGIVTSFGPADAVVTEVAVLDGKNAGEKHSGVLIFQKALMGQLRPKVGTGRMVLGRLGRGVAKAGQSAPWVLLDPNDTDKDAARKYLAAAAAAQDNPPF
jgi:hypothetical protein